MAGEKAVRYFRGLEGSRLGCAEAVAAALKDAGIVGDNIKVEDFAQVTAGRAPQGYCGALYSALKISEEIAPEKQEALKDLFTQEAGSLKCREIRAQKRWSCRECVKRATDFLVPIKK